MSDNIVYLSGQEPKPAGEPRQDIVDMLQFVIERAMRGELMNCVIIAVDNNGSSMRGFSTPEEEPFALLGGIELAKSEIIEQVFSGKPRPLMSSDE
jgi:hypothetical protein